MRGKNIGTTYAEITLKNAGDIANADGGFIKAGEIRSITVQAIVDTGAISLVINEEQRQILGLAIKREKYALVANGEYVKCQETEPVNIHWEDRDTTLSAFVIPGAKKVLLGVIPLEAMDLIVNPGTNELVGAHGDDVVIMAL